MREVSIYFEDFSTAEEAVEEFKRALEREGFIDEFRFWSFEYPDRMLIVNDKRGIHLVYPEKKETFNSFGYSIYTPTYFSDYWDLESQLVQDLKNRGVL